MAKTVLITGGNRGIGLEFVRQYAKNGWDVISVVRSTNNSDYQQVKSGFDNIHEIIMDITDFKEFEKIQQYLQNKTLDLLINCAGISGIRTQTVGNVNSDNMEQVFRINTIAPIMLAQALLEAVKNSPSKVIVNITSKMGSIADNASGKSYAYRSSKAALNAIMKSLQIDIASTGVKVLLLHPGWVRTDMGGPDALIDTKTSVSGMMKLIETAHTLTGQFYDYKGETISW